MDQIAHMRVSKTYLFLTVGGAAVMTNLVSGLSVEMATMMVATVIATYTFIGGLGATFYVSYFNTAFIFVIMIIFLTKVYNEPNNEDNPLGTVSCFNLRDWSLITGRWGGGG